MSNPLLNLHQQAEAEFQAYDDLEIVSTFGEPQVEYAAIHKSVALMDLPQRGFLELAGPDRHSFLNNLISNEVWDKATKSGLSEGKVVYSFFLNLRGRIVADFNVIESGGRTLLETDARLVPMLLATFDKYLFAEKVKMISRVGALHEIALHGPAAATLLGEILQEGIDIPPATAKAITLWNVTAIVWRDDVCGVPGLHLVIDSTEAKTVWMNLVARFSGSVNDRASPDFSSSKRRLRPIGWAAFNTTRIEAGRPLFDIDLPLSAPDRPGAKLRTEVEEAEVEKPTSPGVLPAETGLMNRAVNLSKCYVGQEIVARMHARGAVAKMLVGIRMDDEFLPIAQSPIYDTNQNQIGTVTSSTISPVLSNACLCLGMVKKPHFAVGTAVHVPAEGAIRAGKIVKIPFVEPQ